jgi:multidrug transporter EmrE-like cation transporter
VSITLSVLAQFSMKFGSGRAAAIAMESASTSFLRLLALSMLQPAVIAGFVLYGAGAVLWLYVLARWDVSKAYPLVGFGFVLTLIVGAACFGERVTWERIAGCLLICAGLVLVVRS